MSILEPNADDVKALDDVQLRRLVARLCAAQLRQNGLAETGVTDGGDQRAPDGGIDVMVKAEAARAGPELPALPAGVQVKATPMRPADIRREMRPGGVLREAITDLATAGGAYLVAAGRDDYSEAALSRARAAMREAAGHSEALQTDIYDASRLARWATQFPGVAAWLLAAAGRPTLGWSTASAWSTPGQQSFAYLADERARMVRDGDADMMDLEAGLNAVRAALKRPGGVVRLVGLSGMGKTRLAEAIFDSSIGTDVLSPALAVYGDAGAAPEAPPLSMAQRLVNAGRRAVLIVDNCPGELHRLLCDVVRGAGSPVSLLTIDFDTGPQQPEHTTVFRIDPASDGLIDALLRQRAPHLTREDRERVAVFAQGNTRIALVLARAAKGGGLTGLTDDELLDRLFLNARRGRDRDLRSVAEAAALVYAFEAEGEDGPREVAALAELVGVSNLVFHRKIGDLLERGMAQQRGVQRAVLPPAIAAWLAQDLLARLPASVLLNHMEEKAPRRLARSFARRLSLLDPSPSACRLAELMLAEGGLYSRPRDGIGGEMGIVKDLAPLAPKEALEVVRRLIAERGAAFVASRIFMGRGALVETLQGLARDPLCFEPASAVLAELVCAEPADVTEPIRPRLLQLFQMSHAGTEAATCQRLGVLAAWLARPERALNTLALEALEAALTFNPRHYFLREHQGTIAHTDETSLRTLKEITTWIAQALDLLTAQRSGPMAETARAVFLRRFDALARRALTHDLALAAFELFSEEGPIDGGWFAVCKTLAKADPDRRTTGLVALERRLRPVTIEDCFAVWQYSDWNRWKNPDGPADSGWKQAQQNAVAVGIDAMRTGRWSPLMVRALTNPYTRGYSFGEGCAQGTEDQEVGWQNILATLHGVVGAVINWTAPCGYVDTVRREDPDLADRWIDELLDDPRTRSGGTIILMARHEQGDRDLHRLSAAIRDYSFPDLLGRLQWLRPSEAASDEVVSAFAETLVAMRLSQAAVNFLEARVDADRSWSPRLVQAGIRVIESLNDDDIDDEDIRDYRLSRLLAKVLVGANADEIAGSIIDRTRRLALSTNLWLQGLGQTMTLLCERFPTVVLDRFLLPFADEEQMFRLDHMFMPIRIRDDDDSGALTGTPLAVLTDWVDVDRARRVPLLARVAAVLTEDSEAGPIWTSLALALLDRCDDDTMLDLLHRRLMSGGGTGSMANRLRRRRPMAESLASHSNPRIVAWAAELATSIDRVAARYDEDERRRDQRFE